MSVCVCLCVCMCVHLCARMQPSMLWLFIHVCSRRDFSVWICVSICQDVCRSLYMCTCLCVYMCVCVFACVFFLPSTRDVSRVTLAALRRPAGRLRPIFSRRSLRQRPPFFDFALRGGQGKRGSSFRRCFLCICVRACVRVCLSLWLLLWCASVCPSVRVRVCTKLNSPYVPCQLRCYPVFFSMFFCFASLYSSKI